MNDPVLSDGKRGLSMKTLIWVAALSDLLCILPVVVGVLPLKPGGSETCLVDAGHCLVD